MSMALMVAMASRKGENQERRNEGNENRGEGAQERRNEGNQGNYARMEGDMEMRRRRDERGRYMEDDRMYGEREMESRGERGREMTEGRMEGRRMETGRYDRRGMENRMPWDPFDRMERQEAREMHREPKDPHDPRYNPYGDEESRDPHKMRKDVYGGEISYERPDGGRGNVSYFRAKPEEDREKMMGFRQQQGRKEKGEGFDKQTAMEWVENMEDKDGVKGGMFTWHQAQQYGRNMGITGEQRLVEFYAAMNAMYSDYHAVGKKFGVDRPEFYAHLAKCFIEDPDAVEDKVAVYYECIARKE